MDERRRRLLSAALIGLFAASLVLGAATGPEPARAATPPVASNGSDSTRANTPLALTLDATDADGDQLTFTIVDPPAHGSLDDCSAGSCNYTPTTDYDGPDSFTWKANDGTDDSNVATFTITVVPNSPPEASSDEGSTRVNTPLPLSLFASDGDGDELTYTIVDPPAHGSLASCADGSCTYTPTTHYAGPDSFTWKANDGFDDSNVATFDITVVANNPPVASNDSGSTRVDTPLTILLFASDADDDQLTFTIVDPPAHGTLNACSDGSCTYTPTTDYAGPDSFTWKANDGFDDSNVATFAITVVPNTLPEAFDGNGSTKVNTALPISLLASDADGDSLTFAIVDPPAHGSLSACADGSCTYTPDASYSGSDSFTWKANDGVGDSNVATLSITVRTNIAPVAQDQDATTPSKPLPVALSAFDPDIDPLTYTIVSGPAHGTLDDCSSSFCTYTPASGYLGSDSFTWKANDGTTDSNIATFSITIIPNRPPVATDQSGSTFSKPLSLFLSASDPDFDPLTYSVVSGPAHGTLDDCSTGLCTYTPTAGYVGPDSFTWKANDGTSDSNVATFSITVAANREFQNFTTVFDADFVHAGFGGMRNDGTGTLTVSGVSGTVIKAYLYWHGPTNSTDPAANAAVTFAGNAVTGTNIGFSSDNCWGFSNSQAYRADVTSLVTGNGSFALGGFVKDNGAVNVNGASLIVFYGDGNPANNRDVVLFDGNDSNIHNTFDADGWNVSLSGINYSSGTANITMHVSDGQLFSDDGLVLNSSTLVAAGPIFEGDSVPFGSFDQNGHLWDIKTFDVTTFLSPGPNTLALTTGVNDDCLSLVVAAIDLPAGAAPLPPPRLTLTKTVDNTGGGTALATDWTLSAGGPTPISGSTGSPAINDAIVSPGTYTLAETGPTAYNASAWSCSDGTLTGDSLVLAVGDNASCSITNTFIAPTAQLTLTKTVDNTGGGTALATDWTLSAGGPTPISGSTGSPAVTNAVISPGTYTLAETGPTRYSASGWSCTDGTLTGSSLVLAAGDSASCSITNTFIPSGLIIESYATERTDGEYGLTESLLTTTRDYVLDPANFGPGGIVDKSYQIGPGISVASAATLAGVDVFFTGWVPSGSYTAEEKLALREFVLSGGTLIATTDDTFHSMVDIFGLTQGDGSGSPTVNTITEPAHPIASGPFGAVTTFNQYALTGHYPSLGADAHEVGRNDQGTSLAVIERGALGPGSGTVILVADVDVFSNAAGGAVENATLIKNIFAFVAVEPPRPAISIGDVSRAEGNSGTTDFVLTVSLSAVADGVVSVDYATADGTATAPDDYATAGDTLTFDAGVTSQIVTIAVVGDSTSEADETFLVNLSNASGARLTGPQGVGTIENDDAPNPPPTVVAGADIDAGDLEGASVNLDGTVSNEPASDILTTTWSAAPGGGVDPGATCTFGDLNAVDTSVTCTDDGTWTLTLTADDGVNPPVGDDLTLTLANADPTVEITAPTEGASVTTGATLSLSATLDDPGANDRAQLDCTIDWGDGSPAEAGTVTAAVCSGSHSYTTAGPYTISVTTTDGDGGTGSDTVSITVTDAPVNSAPVLAAIGDQTVRADEILLVELSATDADGDLLTFSAQGLPSFATLTDHLDGTATLRLAPSAAHVGSHLGITLRVSDGTDSDSETIAIVVTEAGCISYPDFDPAVGLSIRAGAAVFGDRLRLTTADPGQRGYAWYAAKVDVAGGFTSDFSIQFTNADGSAPSGAGADGVTFVIQDVSTSVDIPGSEGGYLGYNGLANSLVVELDTFDNGSSFGDPNSNHVAVHSRGEAANGPGAEGDSLLVAAPLTPDLQDGTLRNVRVTYAADGTLNVFVGDLGTPAATVNVDLASLLALDGDSHAYVGFTSATGARSEVHDVTTWTMCPGEPPAPNPPPTVVAGADIDAGDLEGASVNLDGTVSNEPASDILTTTWSAAPGGGVDPGATCTFGDLNAVDTSVTCTDDGTWTLTLTADDGVNPPVGDDLTLTLANADPTVEITAPTEGASVTTGATLSLSATLDDPGANDRAQLDCTIDWGDGSPAEAGTVTAAVCSGSHSYTTAGPYTISVTTTDGDGGTGSDTVSITVQTIAPDCVPSNPPNTLEIRTAPGNLRLDGLPATGQPTFQSNTCLFGFAERKDVTLDRNLNPIAPRATNMAVANPPTRLIPAGTVVDSYLIHGDSLGPSGTGGATLSGSWTFDEPILGVFMGRDNLVVTDALVGLTGTPGLTYEQTLVQRGLEFGSNDVVRVTGPNTIEVTFDFNAMDEIRVLTGVIAPDCVPSNPPNTLEIRTAPGNLRLDGLPATGQPTFQSNTCLFGFAERKDVTLDRNLNPIAPRATNMAVANPPTRLIPAGTVVDSYLIHGDSLGPSGTGGATLSGSWTFDEPILGVFMGRDNLVVTDALVGLTGTPGLTYEQTLVQRGLEFGSNDVVRVTGPNTIEVTFDFNAMDEIRVLTGVIAPDCVPSNPPNTLEIRTAPGNLRLDGLPATGQPTFQSNTCLFGFAERKDVTLDRNLNPIAPRATNMAVANPPTRLIPAGTVVDSYLIHGDSLGPSGTGGATLSGSWTFDEPILGVFMGRDNLVVTDALVGLTGTPGLTYEQTLVQRGLEFGSNDVVRVTGPNTIEVTFDFNAMDEIRVLTGVIAPDCVPSNPPNTLEIRTAPGNLRLDGLPATGQPTFQSNTCLFGFAERKDVTLDRNLNPIAPRATNMAVANPPTRLIPAGTVVDSYLIHGDSLGPSGTGGATLSGSWTFDEPILGVFMGRDNLVVTDALVGLTGTPGLTYEQTLVQRGLEFGSNDVVRVTGPNTIEVTFDFNAMDEIRVLTGVIAPPTGSITIVKDAAPNDAQDFAFAGLGGFTLDDDTDPTLSNTFTASGLASGTYDVTETVPADWSLSGIECNDGDGGTTVEGATVHVDLDPGQNITCTFTNSRDATVTIVKDSVPNAAQDFAFTGSFGPFNLDDDTDPTLPASRTFTVSGTAFGAKTVSETAVAGWTLTVLCSEGTTAGDTATVTVDPGDTITCTFTNTRDATVTIVKDAQPNGPQDFAFTGSFGPFGLDDDTDPTLPSSRTFTMSGTGFGAKTITETIPTSWSLTSLVCSEGTVTGATATITVDPGDVITCTFTNSRDATVTIVKDAVPNAAQDFAFTGSFGPFGLDDDTDPTLPSSRTFTMSGTGFGAKTITETIPTSWSLTSLVCSEGTVTGATATITVDPGDVITCTFTNSRDATVTIVKDAVPNAAQDFAFTGSFGPFSLDDDADPTLPASRTFTVSGTAFGAKTVSETAVVRWELTQISCIGDTEATVSLPTRTVTLDVDPGETITCTYRNTFIDIRPFKTQRNMSQPGSSATTAAIAVQLGDTVRYVIGVNNVGTAAAPSAVITDFIPARLRVTSLGGCVAAPPTGPGTTITCDLGPIPAGQTRSATIEVQAVFACEIVGTRGNDTINFAQGVTNGPDVICGGGGNDTIFGQGGDDTIYGNQPLPMNAAPIPNRMWIDFNANGSEDAGDIAVQVLVNPAPSDDGRDTVEGGTGNDWIDGQDRNDELHGQDGADEIHGSAGDDTITGDAGIDTITGDEDDDAINGGTGSDLINGGLGADSINGGDQGDSVFGGPGNDTIAGESLASSAAGPDTLRGEDGNDTINGAGANDVITGGGGSDILRGSDGNDEISGNDGPDDIAGGDGVDAITGGEASDDLFGNDGNDTINGGERGDTIRGGNGDDLLFGDGNAPFPAGDDIDGDAGDDRILGNDGADTIRGGDGRDDIDGNTGNDVIDGEGDSDRVDGGDGDDQLWGGLQSDIVLGGNGRDRMAGDVGKNPESSQGSPDHMNGGPGRDLMYGQGGSDCSTLLGEGTNANHLSCGAANRIPFAPTVYEAQMFGGSDLDRMHGGPGNDRLDGGPAPGGNPLVGGDGANDFCSFGPAPGDPRAPSCEWPSTGTSTINWRSWDWDLF